MVRLLVAVALAVLALGVEAGDGFELSQRSKSRAAEASDARLGEAPFRAARDPLPAMLLREEQAQRGPRGACEAAASDLCYDLSEGRVVYRPVRRLMPAIDGLRAESVSLRHNRIVFKYSFR